MPATSPNPSTVLSALCHATVALALWGAASAASAQQPLAKPSVDALISSLSAGPSARSFRRTQLPDVGSSLCPGQDAAVAPAAQGARGLGAGAGPTGRNLEVVPYAGDTTPGVNLSVQFGNASDRLTPSDQALLNNLATALKSPSLAQDRFAVAGHTDTSGDDRVNLELSCARALAVRRYLSTKGVQAQRLSAYGFGSTRLLAADEPTAPTNRRVEIRRAPE